MWKEAGYRLESVERDLVSFRVGFEGFSFEVAVFLLNSEEGGNQDGLVEGRSRRITHGKVRSRSCPWEREWIGRRGELEDGERRRHPEKRGTPQRKGWEQDAWERSGIVIKWLDPLSRSVKPIRGDSLNRRELNF